MRQIANNLKFELAARFVATKRESVLLYMLSKHWRVFSGWTGSDEQARNIEKSKYGPRKDDETKRPEQIEFEDVSGCEADKKNEEKEDERI